MKWSTLLWAAAFTTAGALVASGRVLAGTQTGPRLGIATLLLVIGLTLLVTRLVVPLVLRRQARTEGGGANCPVGATCACGHFNLKPRKACKECGAATTFA